MATVVNPRVGSEARPPNTRPARPPDTTSRRTRHLRSPVVGDLTSDDDPTPDDPTLRATIETSYAEGGAPLMHGLGLRLRSATPGRVRFEVDVVDHITHGGGVMCGQAILGCMDTGMVFVMMSLGDPAGRSFTTVSLNTVFERAVPEDVGTVTFEAWSTRPGRTLVFGQVDLFLPDGRRAATATTTYMWI